jgi:hypothetical protein
MTEEHGPQTTLNAAQKAFSYSEMSVKDDGRRGGDPRREKDDVTGSRRQNGRVVPHLKSFAFLALIPVKKAMNQDLIE